MKPKFRKPNEHKFELVKVLRQFKCEKCGLYVSKVPSKPGRCTKIDLTIEEEMIESIIT